MLENMYVKAHTHIYYIIYISPTKPGIGVRVACTKYVHLSFQTVIPSFLAWVYSGKEAVTGLSVACTAPFQRAEVTEATCDPTLPGPRMEGLGPPQECLWWLVLMPNCLRGPLVTDCLGCCRNQAAEEQLL